MASHGPNADALAVNGDRIVRAAQNFVGFHKSFPLLPGLAVLHGPVNPGDKAGTQGNAPVFNGIGIGPQGIGNLPIKIKNR